MKHLSFLESKELLTRTKSLVAEERRATVALIEHLEEISRRMLYAELGYASLWEFATQELGLSEGAAQRRIQAMRLLWMTGRQLLLKRIGCPGRELRELSTSYPRAG